MKDKGKISIDFNSIELKSALIGEPLEISIPFDSSDTDYIVFDEMRVNCEKECYKIYEVYKSLIQAEMIKLSNELKK